MKLLPEGSTHEYDTEWDFINSSCISRSMNMNDVFHIPLGSAPGRKQCVAPSDADPVAITCETPFFYIDEH